MKVKRAYQKALSLMLACCLIMGLIPTVVFAAQKISVDSTAVNVERVQAYAAKLQMDNQKTDYSIGGFTWDTEGKTDSWRYFNGVMMDAFLMEGDSAYADAFYDSIRSTLLMVRYVLIRLLRDRTLTLPVWCRLNWILQVSL